MSIKTCDKSFIIYFMIAAGKDSPNLATPTLPSCHDHLCFIIERELRDPQVVERYEINWLPYNP